ncbi:TPA: hypothetical protein ACKROA_003514 [Pseudomonas aeruginosa]
MFVKKLMSEIKRKKANTVVLLSGDHKKCSCPCDVKNIRKYKVKKSTQYNFNAVKRDDCFEFTLIDGEYIQELWVHENRETSFYSIIEVSQDFETGDFKLIVVDSDFLVEEYHPMFDNTKWLNKNNAKVFYIFASELALDDVK